MHIPAADRKAMKAGRLRVLRLMTDYRWHRADAIRQAAGDGAHDASEGLRRLRELRDLGFHYEKRRCADDARLYEYRLVNRAPELARPPSSGCPKCGWWGLGEQYQPGGRAVCLRCWNEKAAQRARP